MEQNKKYHGENHHIEKEHTGVHKIHHPIKHRKPDTVEINKITLWQGISAILWILLILSIFTGGFGIGKKSAGADTIIKDAQPAQPRQAAPTPSPAPTPEIDMATLIDDDNFKGDKDAPVTIVEFSDFECPFCARFYSKTLSQIDEQYIKTGKVKFVYRDFPLGFHTNAQKAAEAAECAGEQGKFWEMHDKLFEKGVKGGIDSFKQFAADIGIDKTKINDCLDTGKMASEVQKDMADGQAAGVRGTPGFIINGQLVSGAQPFENFKRVIEAELAK